MRPLKLVTASRTNTVGYIALHRRLVVSISKIACMPTHILIRSEWNGVSEMLRGHTQINYVPLKSVNAGLHSFRETQDQHKSSNGNSCLFLDSNKTGRLLHCLFIFCLALKTSLVWWTYHYLTWRVNDSDVFWYIRDITHVPTEHPDTGQIFLHRQFSLDRRFLFDGQFSPSMDSSSSMRFVEESSLANVININASVYLALFRPLKVTRHQFKKVLNCMKLIRQLKYQEVYAQEKVTKVDSLSLVLSGKLVVSQNSRALHIVFSHQFLDSPEWFGVSTDEFFQVSITAMEESRVLIWHRDKLKLTIITDQFLQAVFDHILGRDVVKKLMQRPNGPRCRSRSRLDCR
ncbi:unnamed protein product [Timema podura]|uniref:POPDC1-3 domain-containing protein n=1 Tax=Timema podura TaxID=61482 RepID=A0ABN7PCR0_TIMPD|nr:unnamed protein product [Timema podura]